jgi:dTDP-4-dehydrorhamnose 3,5-epimerase
MTPNHSAPRAIDTDVAAAWQTAIRDTEPIFVPATVYADDRGWSIMNQLKGVLSSQGQINFSVMYPGVIKAWHRHRLQSDFWLCIKGHLKVGLHRQEDGHTWSATVGEMRPGVLIIPPPLWHGATVLGPDTAALFYYVSRAYDPASPDEERRSYDSVPDFDWRTSHR